MKPAFRKEKFHSICVLGIKTSNEDLSGTQFKTSNIRSSLQNLLFFYFILPLLILILPINVYAQSVNSNWQWLHPTPQGEVLRWCKIWDANTWYAGGNEGVFMKTTNGGLNWFINPRAGTYRSAYDYSTTTFSAYFINQNTGILSGEGIRKTTDGGITFNDIPIGSSSLEKLYFLNNNTGYVTVGVGLPRLYKTTDGGNSWNGINSIPSATTWDVYSYDDVLILVLASFGVVQRSTDGGTSWSSINTGDATQMWRMNFMNKDTGFVCGNTGVVRLTTDAGLTWTALSGLPSNTFFDIDFWSVGNQKAVYITGNMNYIYKSTNLGASWDTLGILGPNQVNMFNDGFVDFDATDLLSADSLISVGAYGLINKRFGTSRVSYTNLLRYGWSSGANINGIWAQNGNGKVWAIGGPGTGGNQYVPSDQIMYSSNGGTSWVIQPTGIGYALSSISMINSNTGYVAGQSGVVLITINSGGAWNAVTAPSAGDLNKIFFTDVNTGWVFGTGGSVYKTTNAGTNWLQENSLISVNINSASMVDANTGWLCGDNGAICFTTNGGTNWAVQPSGTTSNIYVIKMLNGNTGYACGNSGLIEKTTNGGSNWVLLSSPASFDNFFSMDFFDTMNGLVSGYQGIVYKTSNGGDSWLVSNTHTQGAVYCMHMVSPDTIYAGGQFTNIFKYTPLSPTGITEWQNQVPVNYQLYQNYPNPFNPSTTIKFAIPKAGNITLKIYDINGKEVAAPIDNLGLNAGTVKYMFDGSKIASGIYFYSLIIDGNLIASKKMVLVK